MRFSQVLGREQLERLTTPRLKAYLHSIHQCHDHRHIDDEIDKGRAEPSYKHDYVTKDTQTWHDLHELVVSILNTREHVPKKKP